MKKTVIIIGPTGSGKDTQANLLHQRYNYNILATGMMVREISKGDSLISSQLTSGMMVSDKLVNNLVENFYKNLADEEPVVSNGFPRQLPQAKWYDDFLTRINRSVEAVICLNVTEASLIKRLKKRSRDDDTPGAIKQRFSLYNTKTIEVINFYSKLNIVTNIDGEQSVEQVHKEICKAIL